MPDNMKIVDGLKARVLQTYVYYDTRYDLPKDLTIKGLIRFLISVKRVKRSEERISARKDLVQLVTEAKALDEKVEEAVAVLKKKKGPAEANDHR